MVEFLKIEKEEPYKFVDIIHVVLGVGMVLFQLISTYYMFQGTTGQQNIHLMLALIIVFLSAYKKARRFRWVFLVFIILSLVPTGYIQLFKEQLEFTTELGEAGGLEIIMGILVVIAPIVACYYAMGAPLVIVALIFIAYVFLGQYLPHAVGHMGYTAERIMIQLSIGLSSGVYGGFLQASLSFIFLFIVFGAVLQITGGTEFFMGIARIVGQKVRGGAAQTAVVGSAMMGTISGSPMANVAITGAYTIPAMKASGFRPHVAGAVEAAASTGGQIMPPIMGAAAFIMASVLGVPYATIMLIGFIPATLYFFGVFSYIFFEAGKWKIAPLRESIDKRELLLRAPLFVVPLGLLVYLLLTGYTVMLAAFWALISAYALSLPRKQTRPSLRQTLDGLTRGATAGCSIAVTCSVLGILAVTMTMTGLGLRIPDILQSLSGGYLAPALLLAFIGAIILGCGLHTVAVYTIVALTVAPWLIVMGVPRLAAHFFTMYGGVFSNVTPPVAVAALVGAGVAGAKFIPTAFQALKIAVPGFVLPFAFIWCPPLMGNFNNIPLDIVALLNVAACLFVLSAALCGYFIMEANWVERGMLMLGAAAFLGFSFTYNYIFLLVAMALMATVVTWQMMRRKKTQSLLVHSS